MNLARSGQPTKIIPREHQRLIQEVTKDPTTSKEVQASLASVTVSVHDTMIRKRPGKEWHPWEISKAKTTVDQNEHKCSSHICEETSS